MNNNTLKIICLLCYIFCIHFTYGQKSKAVQVYEHRIRKINQYNTIKITKDIRILERIVKKVKRGGLSKTMGLAHFYFPLFQAKLKEYGLPRELKYLPIVESNLKTTATSTVGAQGLWQFMYATGKEYGLKKNEMINTFNDPIASTDAACRYLKYLYKELRNWELALAAYNCGIGRVKKILKRTGKKSFWEIMPHLPKETQNYVPSFLAVNYLMYYHKEYNIAPRKFAISYSQIKFNVANKNTPISALRFKTKKEQGIFRFINQHIITTTIPKGAYYYTMR